MYDFIFIDASWKEQRDYFAWAVKLSRSGSCIFVDNAVRQFTESDLDGDPSGPLLVDYVKQEERVEATLVPWTSTLKSEWSDVLDGFLMARVK